MIGAVAIRTLQDGDMVTWDSIMMPGHPGFISAALSRGMVAVTVEVDRATTARQHHLPRRPRGHHSDRPVGQRGAGTSSSTIVRDSRVLAVGSTVLSLGRYGRPRLTEAGGVVPVARPDGANYTVEVRPRDAQRLAVAASGGRLTLAMRSINDSPGGSYVAPARLDELIAAPEELGPPPVRIIRGGQPAADRGERMRVLLQLAAVALILAAWTASAEALRTIVLASGTSEKLEFATDVGSAYIANPETADVNVLDTRTLFLLGRRAGNDQPQGPRRRGRTPGRVHGARRRAVGPCEDGGGQGRRRHRGRGGGRRRRRALRQRHGEERRPGGAPAARHPRGLGRAVGRMRWTSTPRRRSTWRC